MRTAALTLCLVLPIVCASRTAFAVETATRCGDTQPSCETAPITFSHEVALPIQGGFDTGWVPQSSDLQVDLFAELYASTKVDMAGELVTSWPDPLTLKTPGTPGTGNLAIHYGLNVGANAKLHISVLGQDFDWTGPIPYTPKFDFVVDAAKQFDPWAFDGVTVDGSTMQQKLAKVSATSFIGVNIPGLDGGFELDTKVDLAATYKTTAIVITDVNGQPVVGGSILAEDTTTLAGYLGGPSVELDVHPEGAVAYAGTLHLIPAFYISTIGPSFSIPIADIPIPFNIAQDDWVFDSVRVHVPLPDIELAADPPDGSTPDDAANAIDLGAVAVAAQSAKKVTLQNVGEAELDVSFESSDPEHFTLSAGSAKLGTAHSFDELVIFRATEPGDYAATLTISSNDPDEPTRTIALSATASADGATLPITEIVAAPGDGCDCQLASSEAGDGSLLGSLASVVALGAIERRRRRRQRAH